MIGILILYSLGVVVVVGLSEGGLMYCSGIMVMPLSDRDWTLTIGSGHDSSVQFIASLYLRHRERERNGQETECNVLCAWG